LAAGTGIVILDDSVTPSTSCGANSKKRYYGDEHENADGKNDQVAPRV
jgi:hypothetical protein